MIPNPLKYSHIPQRVVLTMAHPHPVSLKTPSESRFILVTVMGPWGLGTVSEAWL